MKSRVVGWLLRPFSWLLGIITLVRNWCFDHGLLKSETYDIPIIGVGNLAVGGTGKTPHVELLARMLRDRRVAVLSRGYGRRTRGFRYVKRTDTAAEAGDEPVQVKRKFPELIVAVDANRRRGISHLLVCNPAPDVILLDDSLQHRYVKPGLQLLLTDYRRLYITDKLLPEGRLREAAGGARRADVIIVTKCPDTLSVEEAEFIRGQLCTTPRQKVFFTTLRYAAAPDPDIHLRGECGRKVVALTGIAHPELFWEYWTQLGWDVMPLRFPDHHRFTHADIRRINQVAETAQLIATTEKDAVRLLGCEGLTATVHSKLFVLPVEVAFLLEGEVDFLEIVRTFANKRG